MQIWEFLYQNIVAEQACILLFVVANEGSTPGRANFSMGISANGDFVGTIGGGIMEHKLVELAKDMLQKQTYQIRLIPQYHDKSHATNQSGMICSGSQTVALLPILGKDAPTIAQILENIKTQQNACVQISQTGISCLEKPTSKLHILETIEPASWQYTFLVDTRPLVHIVGAGHTGLALSQVLQFLDFKVYLYDDRPDLNTFLINTYATQKHIIDYARINEFLPTAPEDYVVIMTIGYRYDKLVLSQLLDRPLKYLGMLGSAAKIQTLKTEFLEAGIPADKLERVFTPIGINIHSKTTQEIAISIAAELIREKNKLDPSQRSYSKT